MRSARINPKPFDAELSNDLFEDGTIALGVMFKNTPKLKKHNFSIQKYVMLEYTQNSEVHSYVGYNSSYIRFDNSPKPSSTLQLFPTAKPGITKDKQKDLKFFLQFLQPEYQEWLSTVTMVGEQTLE